MKSIIQSITTLLIVVITFTSAEFVNANSMTADTLSTTTLTSESPEFKKMERTLLYGLESNVNGVLESTMFNIIAFKTMNPAFDSDKVVEQIREVAIENDSHVIRYKALLTLSYLTDQESFGVTSQLMPLIKSNDANGAFRVLVDSIQEKQIVESRSQK
ncbi:MAG: hypothetical protein GVY08_06265 [Bacteroidetes bacterium]|jgi:hypothetical protein|nr:hypothetical protein [Bacteroidota bacterium]